MVGLSWSDSVLTMSCRVGSSWSDIVLAMNCWAGTSWPNYDLIGLVWCGWCHHDLILFSDHNLLNRYLQWLVGYQFPTLTQFFVRVEELVSSVRKVHFPVWVFLFLLAWVLFLLFSFLVMYPFFPSVFFSSFFVVYPCFAFFLFSCCFLAFFGWRGIPDLLFCISRGRGGYDFLIDVLSFSPWPLVSPFNTCLTIIVCCAHSFCFLPIYIQRNRFDV